MSDSQVLIEARALARLVPDDVLIVDCRFVLTDPPAGDAAFDAAHIPGAVHASLDRDLSDLSKRGLGRHPLPDPTVFAQTLARWGWVPRLQVVAYDDAGGAMAAARLWWMLGSVGIAARVLDGGWQAWTAAGLPVAHGAAADRAASAVPALRFAAKRMVDYAEVEVLRGQPDALIVDARGAPRFRGEVEPIDRVAGHVPGARNRPVAGNLAPDGHFKPAGSLRAEFATLLAGRDAHRVVHMCGSGVFACQNQLAMEIAGLHGSRVFVPSWSGWSSDRSRPVATGE